MRVLILLSLLFVSGTVFGQNDFSKTNITTLCTLIDKRLKDPDPESDFVYLYQRRLSEEAGITSKDTEEKAVQKMQALWKKWRRQLVCNNTKFDTPNASVIKFAISSHFTEFLEDVIFNWKLDLNDIDPVDGRTLLDYVDYQINYNRGTETEKTLNKYRNALIKAGAKSAKDLSKSSR